MAPKPFAIGARFEHLQEAIDKIQYGACELLPPAEYKLAAHTENRGIWTFCTRIACLIIITKARSKLKKRPTAPLV